MSDIIENLFKKALEEVTIDPPTRVWERINYHFVSKHRRQKQLFLYSGIAAAIALLLAFGIILKNRISTIHVTKLATTTTKQSIFVKNNQIVSIISSENLSLPFREDNPESYRISPIINNNSGIVSAIVPEIHIGELKRASKQNTYISLTGDRETLENKKMYVDKLNQQEEYLLAYSEQKLRSTGKISIVGYISPGYTSGIYHQKNTNSRSVQFSNDQMSGLFNVAGGINFSIHPTKRISLETGISYSRLGQKTNEMQVYIPQVTMSSSDANVITSNVQVATPLGNIQSKSQAAVYTMDANIALKNSDMPEGSIEQQFDAIEIPFLFRYQINNNRIKFSIMGGLGASFMIRNEAILTYNGISEDMGETDNIRKFNVTTNFGMGMEYPLTKSIYFRIEPGFKYYLQSLSKDNDINFKPYTFTFSTGIGIDF